MRVITYLSNINMHTLACYIGSAVLLHAATYLHLWWHIFIHFGLKFLRTQLSSQYRVGLIESSHIALHKIPIKHVKSCLICLYGR